MYKIIDGNKACADTAYLFSEVSCIYPITPSSPMASEVDLISSKKEKNIFNDTVKVVEMQSEAGAAGAMHGALLAGSLATTFTASQGLLLMIPNMYKMAGECLPGVIHVASRTIATHALSIFGDHSDIYATRQTGFCFLASTNVEDAGMLAAVAHLSAIEGSLPFVHFFDGFRTSHEINKVNVLESETIKSLINYDAIKKFKKRMLIANPQQHGMAENEDIYFQSIEARNELYDKIPSIVDSYMEKINKITGKNYHPFNYYGAPDATNIIVAMGSVCDTIKLVIDNEIKKGKKIGLIEVHLYRPFAKDYLLKVLPSTVKNIAVLDRTKEAGSIGEPLYLDVLSALKNKSINIVGGRYGISSKNTTPDQIMAVYEMLDTNLKENFTIGINDDVTNLSLKVKPYLLNKHEKEIKIYGFGSDGMVSASKEIMGIIGEKQFVQSYNQYDSKKSGGVTICNMRFSTLPINAPFYVTKPSLIVVTKDEYFHKFNMLNELNENGTLLINTKEYDLNSFLPNHVKKEIVEKKINVLTIDADKIANECGIKGKISKIMEIIILSLLKVENALDVLNNDIEIKFKTKGEDVINANKKAIKLAINKVNKCDTNFTYVEENKKELNVIEKINRRMGETLSVSELIPFRDGAFPCSLSKLEKRHIANVVPKWNPEKCIQCGQCSAVCPHAVIRAFAIKEQNGRGNMIGKPDYNYEIKISEADCTSCGLCINACSTGALSFGEYDDSSAKEAAKWFEEKDNPTDLFNNKTIKGLQFIKPKFEFSGACAGCGETSYIKVLTQLFRDELIIANATGCSSIYGGSAPSTPYGVSWANSLFEDNAEFGYGIYISYKKTRDRLKNIILEIKDNSNESLLYNKWLDNIDNYEITKSIQEELKTKEIDSRVLELIDYIPAKSIWAIGGDGWAYDIGFGGLDHILSSKENINILVLDTEVYSNTGGQSSKSTRLGAVAEFNDSGKKTAKKDLFRIALSYPNCYVASISFGANYAQTIKTLNEAKEHQGPSIVIAYAPCIEHGIKGGMSNSINEQKLVVESGYTILMRYKPEEDRLYIDSKEPNFDKLEDLLMNEVRYSSLVKKYPEYANDLLNLNKKDAINRYNYYKKLSEMDS